MTLLNPQLPEDPILRFTSTAWAKLQLMCHAGSTEIGGFGITAVDDPLLVEEFVTVQQICSEVTVRFDDAAVADFFEMQVDLGRKPEQFARVWLHTHPGSSPTPSGTDEQTFMRVFGKCDWAVLFVLSRTNQTYARLRFNVGPGGDLDLPVEVDYTQPFAASDHAAWLAEYQLHVSAERFITGPALLQPAGSAAALSTGNDWFGQFQGLEPWEKQMLLDDFEVESLSGSFGHGRGDEGGYEL
jgi:proteasome lid subunit RPN8/RPN11